MIARASRRDPYAVLGRFCAILLGVALTWTCAAFGLLILTADTGCNRGPKLARMRVREIGSAIAMYEIDKSRCPADIGDLVSQKYISKQGATDPWGTMFAISCSADDWSARSAGRDRRFGTADDITSDY